MAISANLANDDPASRVATDVAGRHLNASGLVSFLAAGAVLFAGLVIGSSASLLAAGDNALIAAILEGFLELGLWAFGGFLAAIGISLAVAARRA